MESRNRPVTVDLARPCWGPLTFSFSSTRPTPPVVRRRGAPC